MSSRPSGTHESMTTDIGQSDVIKKILQHSAIVRQTYGFGVPSRQLGLKKLSKLTGLSVQGGLITVKRGPRNTRVSNEYALNVDVSTGQLLN